MNNTHKKEKQYGPVSVELAVVNGFTLNDRGGNPAGVVLDADVLTEKEMAHVAAVANMAETAFVSSAPGGRFRLDFFTPNRRIAHCGHATIAAFSYLLSLGKVSEGKTGKETVDGPRDIIIRDGSVYMQQTAPVYTRERDWHGTGVTEQYILESIGVTPDDLDRNGAPVRVNTGNSFVLVGLKSGTRLAKLKTNTDMIEYVSEKLDLIGFYIYTLDADARSDTADAAARMFGPRYAIPEESATGMAAGPLACALRDIHKIDKQTFIIEQGSFMSPPSPSLLNVKLDIQENTIQSLMAGGHGKVMDRMTIELAS